MDKTSALSEGSRSSDGALLSSEILVGVVVGGCVLVLVAALAVGAVCYKQKSNPDKRNLVHASSIGSSFSYFPPNMFHFSFLFLLFMSENMRGVHVVWMSALSYSVCLSAVAVIHSPNKPPNLHYATRIFLFPIFTPS